MIKKVCLLLFTTITMTTIYGAEMPLEGNTEDSQLQLSDQASLLKLPFELQIKILEYLSHHDIGSLAQASQASKSVVNSYREQTNTLNLINQQTIKENFIHTLHTLGRLYCNLKRLTIANKDANSVRATSLTKEIAQALIISFPKLEFLSLVNINMHWSQEFAEIMLINWAKENPTIKLNLQLNEADTRPFNPPLTALEYFSIEPEFPIYMGSY